MWVRVNHVAERAVLPHGTITILRVNAEGKPTRRGSHYMLTDSEGVLPSSEHKRQLFASRKEARHAALNPESVNIMKGTDSMTKTIWARHNDMVDLATKGPLKGAQLYRANGEGLLSAKGRNFTIAWHNAENKLTFIPYNDDMQDLTLEGKVRNAQGTAMFTSKNDAKLALSVFWATSDFPIASSPTTNDKEAAV